jgi:carboxyl-terminal processing protease
MNKGFLSPLRLTALVIVIVVIAGASFLTGAATDRAGLLPGLEAQQPKDTTTEFGVFWEAWNLVKANYVDRKALDNKDLTYGAVRGMVDSLGDIGHSRFLTPTELKAEEDSIAGKLEGIGAEMVSLHGAPTVLAPLPGSPAAKAGIRPGDIIVKVNGVDTTGMTLTEVVDKVRGPAGTKVTLTVIHANQGSMVDITVTRQAINYKSVTWAMLPGTPVAHVLIGEFSQGTTDELVSALNSVKQLGAKSIILDLRNDPGGLQDEAIGVASQFLKSGNVQLEQDAKGNRTPIPVRPGGMATDIPLVCIINEGSASSSEIVAGALQDNARAKLIGQKTFGTGTLLGTYRLSDGSALLLGTAEWLTPKGRVIWHQGISPDISVAQSLDVLPLIPTNEAGMTAEQLKSSGDDQLLRALSAISSEAGIK